MDQPNQVMRNPRPPSLRYCYFSAFSAVAPRVIAQLREQVLGSFRLEATGLELMRQLNLWTWCCEFSVAASLHDCLDDDIKHGLVARAQ
jgi:hypothetical protein